jgi:para-nitrobenzyl esterase
MRIPTLLLATLLLTAAAAHAQIVETPIPGDPVAIDSGLVTGKLLPSGVRAYLGVPFADPPVRDLRWREPQPVTPWKGIYHADRKPNMCMQLMRAHDLNHYFGEEAPSEDCLYLNLWAPLASKPGEKRPVLVFIYGGGFIQGTANLANYSGENLARKGVVFVVFNYRVGALGFMAHPDLSAASSRKSSGNWGLLDQVAALQWIRRNVAQFGGDPTNVTIVGQSAGSASVSYLQASPLARGLIHRVFGMSGSAVVTSGPGRTTTLREAEQSGLQFQAALGAVSIAEMRQLPGDVILAAQRAQGGPRFIPVVDGYVLHAMPSQIFEAGQQNDVPVMLGFMRDESSNALRTARTVDEYKAAAQRLFGEAAGAFLSLYPVSSDADVAGVGARAAREAGMESTMRAWALAQVTTGKAPVYLNMFSRVHPYVEGVKFSDHDPATVGAYHTGEVPYWFQTQDAYNMFRPTRAWTPYDRDLADRMSDALIAFAKAGNPNTAAIAWPRYDPTNEQMLEFGDSIRIVRMNTSGLDFFAAHPVAGRQP